MNYIDNCTAPKISVLEEEAVQWEEEYDDDFIQIRDNSTLATF